MAKKYIVDLSEAEEAQVRSLIKTGKRKARTITRAYILLLANEDKTDEAIASSLQVNVSTVERTRKKFVIGGLDFARSPPDCAKARITLYSQTRQLA